MSRSREIPKETPSKRFRNVLFHLWEKDKDGFGVFDDYYDDRMEKLIIYYEKKTKKRK